MSYHTDNKVSSGEIKETADLLSNHIVLIDGHLLTRLMIRFDIGCRAEEVIHIKKPDEDFFDE